MSKTTKGNYYKNKTKEFYESEGYTVANIEIKYRVPLKDKKTGKPIKDEKTGKQKIIYVKKDLLGGDLIAVKENELIWIQNKTNKVDINKGLLELEKNPLIKGLIKFNKIVVHWQNRAKEPDVYECEKKISHN